MEMKRKNPKAFQTILVPLKAIEDTTGKVGWFESAKYENGTPVALAAAANELGHGSTPPRSFMRTTATEEKDEWSKIAAEQSKLVIQGKISAQTAMDQLTQKAEGDIVKKISTIYDPPLSPITIELRAMKKRDPNLKVTGATVGEAARRVKQPGYVQPAGVNTKPLNDSGLMVATITSITETK